MRFERWRGMPLVLGTAAIGLALIGGGAARADGYHIHKTIPREVAAFDYSTGSQMMAPPIPYGHYAKGGLLDCAGCRMHGMLGCLGCGHNGKGHGLAHGCHGDNCNGDPAGCGLGHGHGGGGHKLGHGGGGLGHHHKAGKFAPCDSCVAAAGGGMIYDPAGPIGPVATAQAMPAGQAIVAPSSQSPCGLNGCGMKDPHKHHGKKCGRCHGKGCGGCGGSGMTGCGDPGCGLCKGGGHGLGHGGHGLGHGGGHGLGHGKLLGGLFGHGNKIEYFVGPGGPVPLTPGYVPYINPVRSPRDFFAFPPMNPYDP